MGFLPLLAAMDTNWTQGLAQLLGCIAVVLVLSFLAALVESGFLTFPTSRARAWLESTNAFERMAGKLRIEFAKPLATMVVVNKTGDIAGSFVVGYFATNYLEGLGIPVQPAFTVFTALLTLIIIIGGEIVPKTIGEHHSLAVAKYSAYPVRFLMVPLSPIVALIGYAQKPFQRIGPHPTSEEEIAQLTSIGQEQGAIEEHEGDMIHRVLALNDITAEQIMTPRVEMIALPADQTLGEASEQIGQINRSLIPVYGKNRDEVVVILDRMDALLALAKDEGQLPLTHPKISFKPYYVPKSMPADELLVMFQRRTEHMAIVVGEYGETVGLVTIEDVLEQIVGEIYDEGDIGSGNGIHKVADDEVLCDAAAEINDLNEVFGMEVPNHRSIAGLLLDEMERIPKKGEEHVVHGLSFRIEDASERAILKVRVKKLPEPVSEEEAAERASEETARE